MASKPNGAEPGPISAPTPQAVSPVAEGDGGTAGPGADGSAVSADGAAPDDVREQFRQALQRKQQQSADGHGGSGNSGPKMRGSSGPVGAKRQFRRKSGG